jgi:hypothetical protein
MSRATGAGVKNCPRADRRDPFSPRATSTRSESTTSDSPNGPGILGPESVATLGNLARKELGAVDQPS